MGLAAINAGRPFAGLARVPRWTAAWLAAPAGLAYGGTDPGGVWAPPAGAPREALSCRSRKMNAARSPEGTAAAAFRAGVRVPARKAATKAGSRLGAVAVMGRSNYHTRVKSRKPSSAG